MSTAPRAPPRCTRSAAMRRTMGTWPWTARAAAPDATNLAYSPKTEKETPMPIKYTCQRCWRVFAGIAQWSEHVDPKGNCIPRQEAKP